MDNQQSGRSTQPLGQDNMAHSANDNEDKTSAGSAASSTNYDVHHNKIDDQQSGSIQPRGKPPTVRKDEMEQILKDNLDNIIVEKSMVKSNMAIYKEIAEALHMTKQAVYLAAKRYVERNGLIPENHADGRVNDEEEYLPLEYFDEIKISTSDICFDINIAQIELFGSNTEKLINNMEWSDTFNAVVWEFSRLPCAWIFNRLKKVCNEFVISGRCKSVNCASIFGYTEANQSRLQIIIKSFDQEIPHFAKRSTKYERKQQINDLLKLNSSSVVRSKLAYEDMMDNEDYEPAHLPNPTALRVQKHRAAKTEYLHLVPTLALREMKDKAKYFECIMDIGLDPFYCMYATPLQRELLRVHTRYQKCVLSYDASGVPVLEPLFSSYSTERGVYKNTFIYTVWLHLPKFKIPVYQFLSQRQRSDFIDYSLSCWKYECFAQKNPDEIIMDDSSALLLAAVDCFTTCKTMCCYLNACFDALFNNGKAPGCYIRLDRSHIVKAIKRNESLKNEDKRRKIFYQRLFGYLILVDDIKVAESIMNNIFILLSNKYENDAFVSAAKRNLKALSDAHVIQMDDADDAENEDIGAVRDDTNKIFSTPSKFRSWIQNMAEDIQQNYVNHSLNCSNLADSSTEYLIDNIYYAPHLQKPFVDFLVKIPLFSNIMQRTFGSHNDVASSSPTETGFNFFKNQLLQHKTRMRVDVLVEKHIDYLLGYMKTFSTQEYLKFASDGIVEDCDETGKRSEEIVNNCDGVDEEKENYYEENWRNKNVDAKKRKPNRKNRCQTSILNPLRPISTPVPVLRNGHRLIGSNKTVGILSTQTCPFDSIFQIYAAFYADSMAFAKIIDNDETEYAELLRNVFNKDFDACKHRSVMLLRLFDENVIDYGKNIKAIDTEMSINRMFMRLASSFSVLQSMMEYKKCNCSFESPKAGKLFIPTNLNSLDLRKLQSAISFSNKTTNCPVCHAVLSNCQDLNRMIAFDIENVDINGMQEQIQLNEISQNVDVKGINFVLRGVVEYRSKHFLAHVRRNDGSWETYDDLKPAKPLKPPTHIKPVMCFYGMSAGEDASSKSFGNSLAINDTIHQTPKPSKQFQKCPGYADGQVTSSKQIGVLLEKNTSVRNEQEGKRLRKSPGYLNSYFLG